MDPNSTLRDLLTIRDRFRDGCSCADGACVHADTLAKTAELIDALDGWLRRGGVAPGAWRRSK